MSVEVGAILEGKVVSIMPFGAFVSLPDGKSGLVHISEVAADYVKDVNEHLKEGETVKVKVIKIDDKGKISLSIKRALAREQHSDKRSQPRGPVRPVDIDWGKKTNENMSFEDKLSKFKSDSDERMQSLRRSADSKRSGGYRRGGGSY
jgi:S1 RNA binding domain protein